MLHYRNLKQYLELGMVLTKAHRGISFYKSKWIEPYIQKNTNLRKTASNSFEKDFFKLMNNLSVLKNNRKHQKETERNIDR